MPPSFDQPVLVLLHGQGGEPGKPGADAPDRRAVSGDALVRLAPDGPALAARRRPRRPSPGSPADAVDGPSGHLPGTENQRAASRAPGLSLSSQGARDRSESKTGDGGSRSRNSSVRPRNSDRARARGPLHAKASVDQELFEPEQAPFSHPFPCLSDEDPNHGEDKEDSE